MSKCAECRWANREAERELRRAVERTVEELLAKVHRLIGTLDRIYPDSDYEPNGDLEPGEDEEPGGDLEPTLGWCSWDEPPAAWVSPGGVGIDFDE